MWNVFHRSMCLNLQFPATDFFLESVDPLGDATLLEEVGLEVGSLMVS